MRRHDTVHRLIRREIHHPTAAFDALVDQTVHPPAGIHATARTLDAR
jgi:hypothetical protein